MAVTIYWFSGTGNSLYAAKHLASELGETLLFPMTAGVPPEAVGGSGEKLGFVFPSYYCDLPRIVRSFVEKIKIRDGTYLFTIVTMGGLGQGSVAALDSALKHKNLRLDYGRGILMPANYVVNYNPADKTKIEKKLDKTNSKIKRISLQVKAGVRSVKKINFSSDKLYKNIEALDSQYYAEDSCTACGQCAKICPVGNIKIENNKPCWLHHCEHCVTCISWCPAKAIQYGEKTKTRRRYQNPKITVNEILGSSRKFI